MKKNNKVYIFLLSLFYISTTTRHTLENRRFLEANLNEKFCGTIRETLCECAAPSSMESYIYNIVCIACVTVSIMEVMCVCVCTCIVGVSLHLSWYSCVSPSLFFLFCFSLALSLFHSLAFSCTLGVALRVYL